MVVGEFRGVVECRIFKAGDTGRLVGGWVGGW